MYKPNFKVTDTAGVLGNILLCLFCTFRYFLHTLFSPSFHLQNPFLCRLEKSRIVRVGFESLRIRQLIIPLNNSYIAFHG